MAITTAGLAEIKPHNDAAIRKGLYQLRAYLQQSDAARGAGGPGGGSGGGSGGAQHGGTGGAKRQAWMAGSEPERKSVWLITYQPWSASGAPTHVRVFAHELKRDALVRKGPLPRLDQLLLSRRELPKVVLPKTMPFPHPGKPDLFGLAVEPLVRDRFAQEYQRPLAKRQRLARRGPDVLWRELEDLFRELADETGDAYWREVAEVLSAGT